MQMLQGWKLLWILCDGCNRNDEKTMQSVSPWLIVNCRAPAMKASNWLREISEMTCNQAKNQAKQQPSEELV